MGHPQPPIAIYTDNSTAHGILNGTVTQNRSKAIDMRFYWLRDRVKQGQFKIIWAPGATNLADYFTKHHSPAHHKRVRPIYLQEANSPTDMQGCVAKLSRPCNSPGARPGQRTGTRARSTQTSQLTLQALANLLTKTALTHEKLRHSYHLAHNI